MGTQTSHPHINTSFRNFVEIPARGLKWLLNKLKLREILKTSVQDPRRSKSPYSIDSLLMSGLFISLFRKPSRHEFYLHLSKPYIHRRNLSFLAGIKGDSFPSTRTLEDNFQICNPKGLQEVLFSLFENLCKSKVFINHPSLLSEGRYCLAIDAFHIHTYYPISQHPCRSCPCCLKRERGDKVWYLHMIVVASFVSSQGFQFPLYIHRIKKSVVDSSTSDKDFKEQCEFSSLPIILSPDNPLIIHQFATKRFEVYQSIRFFNDLAPSSSTHSLNILELDEFAKKKPSKRFAKVHEKQSHWQWIVYATLNPSNSIQRAAEARNRWQEEDLGNTLKNRGFHLKHDFSRHPHSQSIWLFLIFIAFGLTSIFLLSEIGFLSKKKNTVVFLMKEMLTELLYFPFDFLFNFQGKAPKLLRFYVVPAAG